MPSHQKRRTPLPKDYQFGDARGTSYTVTVAYPPWPSGWTTATRYNFSATLPDDTFDTDRDLGDER